MHDAISRGYRAVEVLHHGFLTGLILTTVSRRSDADAAELVFRTFRRQHLEKFLPGLAKLGLSVLPHAVACAQYHYLSNHLGGVRVEYMYESDRKAWVRYVPPRWIYEGAAICGVPGEVSRAMLRGWHAHNGVSLGNPRLGFVCTKQTTDGQPGLEGYYLEYDRDLAPDERLRFAPGEDGPDFDPGRAPRVEGADWPAERFRKIVRNYAMDYVRTTLPVLAETFGEAEARHLGGVTGRLIGMQYYFETAELLGIKDNGPEAFAEYLVRMGQAQDDRMSRRRTRLSSIHGTRSGGGRSPSITATCCSRYAAVSIGAIRASSGACARSRVLPDRPVRPPTGPCARARATRTGRRASPETVRESLRGSSRIRDARWCR